MTYIVTISEKGFPNAIAGTADGARLDCFRKVCQSLYNVYSENPDLEGMDRRFRVFCEDGNCRPAGGVCLWDESRTVGISAILEEAVIATRYRLKYSLQEWCAILEPEKVVDESLLARMRHFWESFMGVSLGFPVKYSYCGEDEGYLTSQFPCAEVPSGEKLQPWYFAIGKFRSSDSRGAENDDLKSSSKQVDQNFVRYLDDGFINELISNGRSPIEILKKLAESPEVYRNIVGKQSLLFWLRGVKPCTFQTSYMAWKLKRCKSMRTLEVREVHPGGTEDECRLVAVLKALGLAKDITCMTPTELYDRLANYAKNIGVQNHYASIRKALRDLIQRNVVTEDECAELAKQKLPRLYARLGRDGEVKLFDRQAVYYWDNAIVSRALLEQLPKLEIGGRVGAKSVEKLFGVHSLRADDVELVEGVKERIVMTDVLTGELKNALIAKRKYLIAARLKDTVVDDVGAEVKKLDWASLSVVRPCENVYRIRTNVEKTFSLEDGDVLQTPEVFWVCTTHESLDEALNDRKFCDSIVEALCVRFGLTGTQIESSFREVLRSTDEENEYYGRRDVSEETWEMVKDAIGVPADEIEYWRAAAAGLGKELSEDAVRGLQLRNGQWKTDVAAWAGLDALPEELVALPDFPAMSCNDLLKLSAFCKTPFSAFRGEARRKLYDYVAEEVDDIRFGAEKCFASALYVKMLQKQDQQQDYVENVQRFMKSSTWAPMIDALLSSETFSDDVGEAIKDGVISFVKKEFDVEMMDGEKEFRPVPLAAYNEILKGRKLNELDFQVQSLVLFPGNEHRVEAFLSAMDVDQESIETKDEQVQEDGNEALKVVCVTKDNLKCLTSHGHAVARADALHTKGQHFASDDVKRKKGESAEKIATRLLEKWVADGICESFQPRSSISNCKEGDECTAFADDGAHFDFWFKPKGERVRFLEVKAYSGSRILMSAAEYDTACSNRYSDRYDLCLVKDGVPYYIKGPIFGKKSLYKSRISPVPETWSVRVSIEDENQA